jgi:hypothetical protein
MRYVRYAQFEQLNTGDIMAALELALITGGELAVPAHLAAFNDDSNIAVRDSLPTLSFKGKVWRTKIEGEEVQLMRKNADGDTEPVPMVKIVVLDANRNRSRAYYEGSFVEGSSKAPDCWSGDGIKPDKDVKQPCAATCASCPNSVKGSKINDNGKETTACSATKRVAVLPIAKLTMAPMLLKIPQTSIWDKNNAEHEATGFYAWDQYLDFLRARGAKHTAAVVTKVKFDPNVAYPKLLFAAERWLEEAEMQAIIPVYKSEAVQKIINGVEPTEEVTQPTKALTAPEDDGFDAPAPTPKTAPKVAPKVAPKATASTSSADDDGFSGAPTAAPAVVKPKATPANVASAVPTTNKSLDDLAAEWDD